MLNPNPEPTRPIPAQMGNSHEPRESKIHDPFQYRTESLKWNVTPGAVAVEKVLSLSELNALVSALPGSTIVVSDIHGYVDLLAETLSGLGLLSENRERLNDKVKLVAIGDVVDGRRDTDLETAELVTAVFDTVVCGNHDAAHLDGQLIPGMAKRPEVNSMVRRMTYTGQLVAALPVGSDILLTHGGVHESLFLDLRDPHEIAKQLNECWFEFVGNAGNRSKLLFEVSAYRINNEMRKMLAPEGGGVLWEDWNNLVRHHPKEFRQIVGHTNIGRPERSESGLVYAIDLAGYRLGIAVIAPNGDIHIGSSFISE